MKMIKSTVQMGVIATSLLACSPAVPHSKNLARAVDAKQTSSSDVESSLLTKGIEEQRAQIRFDEQVAIEKSSKDLGRHGRGALSRDIVLQPAR